jgi:hypothetical protein
METDMTPFQYAARRDALRKDYETKRKELAERGADINEKQGHAAKHLKTLRDLDREFGH